MLGGPQYLFVLVGLPGCGSSALCSALLPRCPLLYHLKCGGGGDVQSWLANGRPVNMAQVNPMELQQCLAMLNSGAQL